MIIKLLTIKGQTASLIILVCLAKLLMKQISIGEKMPSNRKSFLNSFLCKNLYICNLITSRQTPTAEEDFVIRSEAPEKLLNAPFCHLVFQGKE